MFVTLTSVSVKISNGMGMLINDGEWKDCLVLLTSQTSLPVSVTQVNTTVSPGHSISADDVSVTV